MFIFHGQAPLTPVDFIDDVFWSSCFRRLSNKLSVQEIVVKVNVVNCFLLAKTLKTAGVWIWKGNGYSITMTCFTRKLDIAKSFIALLKL